MALIQLKKEDMLILPKHWQVNRSLKTVEIHAKEWFDKLNGNSYYSGKVFVNTGLKNAFSFTMQFDYGYGNYYIQKASELLRQHGITKQDIRDFSLMSDLKIKVVSNKQEKCLKRDVKLYGKWGL